MHNQQSALKLTCLTFKLKKQYASITQAENSLPIRHLISKSSSDKILMQDIYDTLTNEISYRNQWEKKKKVKVISVNTFIPNTISISTRT